MSDRAKLLLALGLGVVVWFLFVRPRQSSVGAGMVGATPPQAKRTPPVLELAPVRVDFTPEVLGTTQVSQLETS